MKWISVHPHYTLLINFCGVVPKGEPKEKPQFSRMVTPKEMTPPKYGHKGTPDPSRITGHVLLGGCPICGLGWWSGGLKSSFFLGTHWKPIQTTNFQGQFGVWVLEVWRSCTIDIRGRYCLAMNPTTKAPPMKIHTHSATCERPSTKQSETTETLGKPLFPARIGRFGGRLLASHPPVTNRTLNRQRILIPKK